ncbi:divergent polysaccharide deacetylase family protein [bacterium]|nr:MAG: divergent polysaccharide deacetylase family protein [bacterium]
MKPSTGYKIAVFILTAVIIVQWIAIIKLRPKKALEIAVIPAVKGKIAIVLDDWGYNLNNLAALSQIKYPLTLSVLPNLGYSKNAAIQLYQRGFQVILHLPMEPEPREKVRLEKNTVLTKMDEAAIKSTIAQDLVNVPYARGISNHMGSKATQDIKTMTVIFKEVKKKHLYFLDSFVSGDSVCLDLAHKMHLPFARRDVFLDNHDDPQYIRGQIYKLKTRAKIYGQAVGIGHDRKVTLEVLKEVMPKLAKEGYKFVFVSELAK